MADPDLNQRKRDARRLARAAIAAIGPDRRAAASAAICRRLADLEAFGRADMVMAFWPLDDEPDIRSAIASALEGGARICLPRMLSGADADRGLDPVEIARADFPRVRAEFGVVEPDGGRVVGMDEIDLILVPGVVFDRSGRRVGRGKGFYDRLLAGWSAGATCGICFGDQIATHAPAGPDDVAVRLLVTEAEAIEC